MTKLKTVLRGFVSMYRSISPSRQVPGSCTHGGERPPYCWARSAVLLAFIFSRRLARWLLVISISSILSSAVRNWRQSTVTSQSGTAPALPCCAGDRGSASGARGLAQDPTSLLFPSQSVRDVNGANGDCFLKSQKGYTAPGQRAGPEQRKRTALPLPA